MNPESEIRKLLKEFIEKDNNLLMTERIFVAASVLNWAYLNYQDKNMLQYYLEQVKKHLRHEITLYWENGVVKIKRGSR